MSTPHDEGPFIRRASDADSGELATVDLDDAMRPRPPGRGRAWRTAAAVAHNAGDTRPIWSASWAMREDVRVP